MAVGYRNSAGTDFDTLFQPGTTQAAGFRKTDGTNLRYAPRGTTPKVPDVGYRDENGSDLSNLWMARQTAPPPPGFNGGFYDCQAQAPTNQTGSTSASLLIVMRPTGVWEVIASKVGAFGEGTEVLASGIWLPTGTTAGQYTVRFAVDAGTGQGTVSNSAPAATSLASTQSVQLEALVPASSSQIRTDMRTVTTTLTRVGSGSSVATTSLSVSAAGWR